MLSASISHRKTEPQASTIKDGDTSSAETIATTTIRHANTSARASKSRGPSLQWWLMAIPSFLISAHGALFFTGMTPGDPEIKARILSSTGGCVHIAGSFVAMGLGPFQFLPSLRRHYPAIHRWLGWVYAAAVTFGGVAAFYVTFHSLALPWGRVGFALLACAWLETLRRSILAIRRDADLKSHRAWMTRNFALTYAAAMLRWQFPLMLVSGMEARFALSLTGFSCWIPNLVFVEYLVLGGLAK
ncbi:hypothetical protein CkaCkLH20_11253 [Colletotrichum karsti]|uniref:Uncharacterized protein n=1 Tax=Colletotrichum karsti TaxID=1095194 RepID=A0A9P6HUK1_9PEZI|nr:uncharacterized protein CkaCkLH20_11253 [Colletotrichum karsti]KAF9871332.1 hypothetical protein CkaCkLH20_11253 [Colletotrichum karsti]